MDIRKVDSKNRSESELQNLAIELSAFCQQCFLDTYVGLETPKEIVLSYAEQTFTSENVLADLVHPTTEFFLVRDESQALVGYVKSDQDPPPQPLPGTLVHVARFYLAKDLQGKGFGPKLLRIFESDAVDQGFSGIWLSVYKHNLPAKSFYTKNGFNLVGDIPWTHLYDGKEYTDMDLVYSKNLGSDSSY